MINRKNKPAALNISQFVESAKQNVRPVQSVSPAAATEESEEKKDGEATSQQETTGQQPMQVEVREESDGEETEEGISPVSAENKDTDTALEQVPKRKRPVQKKGVKRDKLVAIRFDRKLHKEISRIKLEYEIDIQDFVYIAVDRLKQEFFPNGKATKEGLETIKKGIDIINGKESED